jgi:hypothetical protein
VPDRARQFGDAELAASDVYQRAHHPPHHLVQKPIRFNLDLYESGSGLA